MKRNLLLLIFSFCQIISAQNLVMNPSFETSNKGPWTYGEFVNNVHHWSTPNTGTPDYFSINSRKMNETNYRGIQKPKTGDDYAGIYTYTTKDGSTYREYIQGELHSTLEKDKTYTVTFYLSLAENSSHSINEMHLVFSQQQINAPENPSSLFNKNYSKSELSDGCLKIETIKNHTINTISTSDASFLNYDWVTVSFEYKARGFENFFTIGNLNSNKNAETTQQNPIEDRALSYYYIDEISITEQIKSTFETEKTYTFKNVLFDFDKAILLNQSIEELNQLSEHLKTHPELSIEIYGHTDNVGLKSRNKELSQQRAEAVSKYLIEKGLNKKRIKWFGFGAEQPVVKNDSDKNRSLNRRVNFKLIEL